MAGDRMDRKEFIDTLGRAGVGACMCGAVLGMQAAFAAEPAAKPKSAASAEKAETPSETKPGEKSVARSAKRMEFVDEWTPRFFAVVDQNLDEPTRRRLMEANGKACFSAFAKDMQRRPEPATLEKISAWVAQQGKERGYSMEGNVISFEYLSSAETGQASPQSICLCPLVEAQTAKTMSPTFCICSVGYVREMHERVFGRPVQVQLTDLVLMGGSRCRFRITLA